MRMNKGQYLICAAAVFGMVACQQQEQQIEQPVTPVVKPVVKPRPRVRPVRKHEAAEPVKQPVVSKAQQPARLRPLGKKVASVSMKGKYVALTFDDGPHPALTRKAVDILNRHGAKGTFFMLGENVKRYPSIVASVAASGHELGVHTWTHIKMNAVTRARVDNEINRTQNLIGRISGTYPRVMRPPYGATNQTLVNHMYNGYGMATILWDVDTQDWRKPGVSSVINKAVNGAGPGSIILVHDIHASTLNALEGIVTGLQARGYKLVTVSELMMIGKQEAAEAAAAKAAAEAAAKAAAEAAAVQQAARDIEKAEAAAEAAPAQVQPVSEYPAVPQSGDETPLKLENFILN